MSNEEAERALTEREKMVRGLAYDAMEDPDLVAGRLRARKYTKAYNVCYLLKSPFVFFWFY